MTEVSEDFKNLELDYNIFKDVKYYITGEVEENILELLRNGGAERMNYFSDYVTHLICGNEPEDTDLSDAVEVYEIPAVTVKWVVYSSHLKRLLSTTPYLYNVNKLFSNLNFCFSSVGRDRNTLWAIITYHGGNVLANLDSNCNYLITTSTTSEKYLKVLSLEQESIYIVTPDWVIETVRNKSFAPVEIYHPRLIAWPKVVKHESTTAITGFEPDELNPNESELDNILPDSTQALLEELKQRMPWNQPQTSLSNETAPPNVVAPSYTGSKLQPQHQEVQQRLFNQSQQQLNIQKSQAQPQQLNFLPPSTQVPRSIVHHPPQSPLSQQNQQQLQFTVNQPQQQQQQQQQPPPQIAFSQANLTSSQRLRIIEQMQQNRAQRLQQNQFNQLQQQQRVQQLQQQQQQVNQVQQDGQMGQVNQQQQVVNQLRQVTQPQQQQVAQPNQQQLILGAQNQENQRQLLQSIQQQQQGQQQQLIQNQQLRSGGQPQQVTALTQLQMVQNQTQQQHSTLNQLAKATPTSIQQQQQQQHLSPQQLLQRQLQNQHLLKSQHLLQNQQQQLQNQLNQQTQQGQQQQSQLNQQLLQAQQSQDALQQQQTHLEQQLSQQTQLSQPQQQLNQRQLNQLNQHLLQNQLAQQNQQNQLNQQQQLRQNQLTAQQQQQLNQLSQNRLNIQQQQSKIMQSQFNQQQAQQQQIINQQTVVVSQNQQNVLQQQFGSPNSQQFQQQQAFVQQQTQFNQPQPAQQLIQTQQGQQQVIACQQQQVQVQQQQQQQLLAQQQMKPQQIIGQQQLVNQKLNIQQIGGQQHILLQQQQPQQVQGTQESPQRSTNQHIWQQQPQTPSPAPTPQPQQVQINIQRHPNVPGQGPRVQWAPNQQPGVVLPQRQYIHLDEQTHQQLQQMSPEDRALFVQKLHKQRQQQALQNRMQQRPGHILIRGGVPIGLNSQQQMQWLQQQAKQQGVVLQQQTVSQGAIVQQANPNLQHATPGLSPIQQQTQFTDQNQQLQLQRQQQQQQLRLQQLQLHQQREQAQKAALQQPQGQPPLAQPAQPTVVRALVQSQVVEGGGVVQGPTPVVVDPNVVQAPQSPLVVNSKTKTALANMLNTRLQSGGSTLSENIAEPSAAGTLKLMTAQHNAALNTGNRPHDLLFFQQRRIINRPSTEVIRPPPAQSVPPGPPIDPPKLQYSPRNSVPLQHRPGTYYGHNPNLKLPPDLFLLGCVFVIVELERFLDESMPGWQKKIEKHGGEIEKQYCNRVTHVICETQRHGVVMQALRDFKRCVTLYWLSDVINRKQVLPPWIALHLPTMYWDTAPASKHLICLTGFLATERERVKHMIKYIGAGLTTYFSKHNTLLITTKAEGPKYNHAKKWGTPIVNVQWLTDIMLGHFTALNQLEHVKYQHFTDPPNFSFDPLLVPNLMHAWKMPINISQESYEKVKRSASPVVMPPNSKPKKIKLEQTTVTDENDNEDLILQSTATYRVMLSMCIEAEEFKKFIRQLGGVVTKSFTDCTHLIMPQLKRTHKLLCSICVGSYIVPESWLRDSHAAGKFLDESNYTLDTKDFNSEFKCDFNQTLSTKNRNKLFEGKHFFITPSIVPRKKELVELIELCGGNVERNRRTLAQIEATNVSSPYSYIILTHENDLHLVADLLKNKKDKVRIVCNSELVLSAILKQTFEVEPYAVKFL